MFTIKACHTDGPVWIGGISEIRTVTDEPGEVHPYDWMASDEGKEVLAGIGEGYGLRLSGTLDDGQPWTLLRVVGDDRASNLVVPSNYTFLLNEQGSTIDRI